MRKYFLNKSIFNEVKRLYCNKITHFKPLQIPGLDTSTSEKKERPTKEKPRVSYLNMDGNEDWCDLWPSARSFNYNIVPLPVRQGYPKNMVENKGIIPEKYGNAELMKIPNFLHLTPCHIERHCNAIKKYCTEWPESLNEVTLENYFPLEFVQTDYIHSAPSIRDERARVVTLSFNLKQLKFDDRERLKFIKLLGPKRYDKKTDMVTIMADRCPSNRQNYDYLIYVLTALTKESKKFESWELEIEESDWIDFQWEKTSLKETFDSLIEKGKVHQNVRENKKEIEKILKSSVEKLYNDGDSVEAIELYKSGVLKLLNITSRECTQSVN